MSLPSLQPSSETHTHTYMINGPVTIGESPNYTTNLRGRTYMKDVQPIDQLINPTEHSHVVVCYGSNRENFIIPSGDAGQVLTLVDSGNGIAIPKWEDSGCSSITPIYNYSSGNFAMIAFANTSNPQDFQYDKTEIVNMSHPFLGYEEYQLYNQNPFTILGNNNPKIIEINLGNETSDEYRKWNVTSIEIYYKEDGSSDYLNLSSDQYSTSFRYNTIGSNGTRLRVRFQLDLTDPALCIVYMVLRKYNI